jgi:hypothetical protein
MCGFITCVEMRAPGLEGAWFACWLLLDVWPFARIRRRLRVRDV